MFWLAFPVYYPQFCTHCLCLSIVADLFEKKLALSKFTTAQRLNFSFHSWTIHASTLSVHSSSSWLRLHILVERLSLSCCSLLYVLYVLQVLLVQVTTYILFSWFSKPAFVSVSVQVWQTTIFTVSEKMATSVYSLGHDALPSVYLPSVYLLFQKSLMLTSSPIIIKQLPKPKSQ